MHLRFDADTRFAAHIQSTDALGPVRLVRSEAHQIDRQSAQIHSHTTGRLRRVHVENYSSCTADGTNGRDVLNHTNLVVDKHHAGQNRIRADRRLENFQVEQTIALHIQISHLKPLALQLTTSVQNRFVFSLHRNNVFALGLVETGRPLERQVVGLGRTRRPDDLARVSAHQFGYINTRLLNRRFSLPAPGMAARRRVAKMLAQPRHHGIDHPLITRVGGAVVHIDRKMGRCVHGWVAEAE